MTQDSPKLITMKAIDVRPWQYAVWSSIGDEEPFSNTIVHRKWSEDGARIWWMLDSHNFIAYTPDDMVKVIQKENPYLPKDHETEPEKFLTMRPKPPVICQHCGQKIPVEKQDQDPFSDM